MSPRRGWRNERVSSEPPVQPDDRRESIAKTLVIQRQQHAGGDEGRPGNVPLEPAGYGRLVEAAGVDGCNRGVGDTERIAAHGNVAIREPAGVTDHPADE